MSPLVAYLIASQFPALLLQVIFFFFWRSGHSPVFGVGLILLGLMSFALVLAGMVLLSLIHGQVHYEGIDIRELRHAYDDDVMASKAESLLVDDAADDFMIRYIRYCRAYVFRRVFPASRKYKLDLLARFVRVDCNVEEEDIDSVQGKVKNSLEYIGHHEHTGATSSLTKHIPILPKQRKGKQPSKWLLISLFDGHDDLSSMTTIAMRNDNLYLVGFSNESGQWFVFEDMMSQFPTTKRASRLPFGGKYSDLLDGGHKSLHKYSMNKMSMLNAVGLLANHEAEYSSGGNEAYNTELKLAMVTVIFVLAEAARFAGILETLRQGWQAPTTSNISKEHAKLVVLWAAMSHALLKSGKSTNQSNKSWPPHLEPWEVKELKRYKIKGPDDAAGKLNLLLPSEWFFRP